MPASALGLRDGDRDVLSGWVRSRTVPAGLAQRARIVLLAADGTPNVQIAEQLGVSRPTINLWRSRYETSGLMGLADRPKPGRPRQIDRSRILTTTLKPPPKKLGITHWSSRLLANHLKVSQSVVLRCWRFYGVQPWREGTFKFSTDPQLEAKVVIPPHRRDHHHHRPRRLGPHHADPGIRHHPHRYRLRGRHRHRRHHRRRDCPHDHSHQ